MREVLNKWFFMQVYRFTVMYNLISASSKSLQMTGGYRFWAEKLNTVAIYEALKNYLIFPLMLPFLFLDDCMDEGCGRILFCFAFSNTHVHTKSL